MARPKADGVSKADVIRQALKDYADMGPTEMAAKLNAKVKKEGLDLKEIKPSEISVYRSQAKHEGAAAPPKGASTAQAVSTKPPAAKPAPATSQASVTELLQNARNLVDQLGKDEAKKVIDLL